MAKKKKNQVFLPGKIAQEKLAFLINKEADFAFAGEKFKFYLSHALFSSFDIDEGTKILLKTIVQKSDLSTAADIKDIGAGIGIIGICLKKKYPQLAVTFTDRDKLALDFTEINCKANGIREYKLLSELGIETINEKFDFIVSNIPAKIGDKGFEDIISKILLSLKPNGFCAVVVIKPLESKFRELFSLTKARIIYEEESRAHCVFHFKPNDIIENNIENKNVIEPYLRDAVTLNYFNISYKLNSIYNLPDFNTLGYQSALLVDMLADGKLSDTCLFWNPLQGHIPVLAAKLFPGKINKIILAGRDLSQLKITKNNLELNGFADKDIVIMHSALISEIIEPVQNYIVIPDVIPMVNMFDIVLKDLQKAPVFVSDKSTNIFRLLENQKAYNVVKKIKKNGFSAVHLRKK